jgi:hypothetical protein
MGAVRKPGRPRRSTRPSSKPLSPRDASLLTLIAQASREAQQRLVRQLSVDAEEIGRALVADRAQLADPSEFSEDARVTADEIRKWRRAGSRTKVLAHR